MDNVQEGLVIENNGTFSRIKVLAHSNCENCGTCASSDITFQAYNSLNAEIGQKIKFIMPQNNSIKITFILFFLPLISIFSGVYLGNLIAEKFYYNQVVMMTIFGALFFIFSVIYIVFYEKRSKLNHKNIARITEIIS
jgi:sigma-E factor negative regulatory protein RseC